MKSGMPISILALVLALGGGCGDDDDDSSGGGDLCAKACAAGMAASCPNDDESSCKTECEAMLGMQTCQAENRALVQCTGNQPASNFECDSFGEAELKSGICNAEGTAAMTCLLGGMGGAGGSEAGSGGGEWFDCGDGDSIPPDWVCDGGEPDCANGADEQNC